MHTKTIAYSLRVAGTSGVWTADWLQKRAVAQGVNITGSHVDGRTGVLRFRTFNDTDAIAVATALIGDREATLESGFGVNRRVVART